MAPSPLTLLRAEGGSVDTIQPTPQSPALGGLADVLEYLRTAGNSKTILPPDSWLAQKFGGAGRIGDLLLGKSPEEVREWSYGNAPMRLPPAGTGGYVPDFKRTLAVDEATGNRKPGNVRSNRSDSLADTLFAAQPALPLAKAAGRAGVRGGLQAIQAGMSGSGPLRGVLAPVAPAYAVKPKGGNFDPTGLDQYLMDNFRDKKGATASWRDKQLRNYISKELGSPSDPLLQVEKEYPNLHLADDTLDQDYAVNQYINRPWDGVKEIAAARGVDPQDLKITRGSNAASLFRSQTDAAEAKAHYALTQDPLTPWGRHSGMAMVDRNPKEYEELLEGIGHDVPDWVGKAPPETKIWGLGDEEVMGDRNDLGFGHVLDYLDAAQAPYRELEQGTESFMKPGEARDWVGRLLAGDEAGVADFNDPRAIGRWRALHASGLTLTPEQVARTSVADAVRKTAQWNKFMAEQGVDAAPGLAKGIAAVHKEYPEEGMKWVKLGVAPVAPSAETSLDALKKIWSVRETPGKYPGDPPVFSYVEGRPGAPVNSGKYASEEEAWEAAQKEAQSRHARAELSEGLNAEGDAMGHCVGGYCEDVASRGTEIYSLRDAKGNPHVTVEARPGNWYKALQEVAPTPMDSLPFNNELRNRMKAAGAVIGSDRSKEDELGNALFQEMYGYAPKQEIVQIKGKQNAAPVDKYLPFVQDFVKSGQWGRVGDLGNTGLVQFNGGKTNIRHSADHTYTGLEMPKGYMTPEEASQHLQAQGVPAPIADQHVGNYKGAKGPRLEFAHGGSVVPKFSKKAALLARLNAR